MAGGLTSTSSCVFLVQTGVSGKKCLLRQIQLEIREIIAVYIVACQRVGVSNKPAWAPGSDKTRGQGSFGPFTGG